MPWGKLDDSLYDHPKLDALGRDRMAGVGLWTLAISWCNRRLTDGFVPLDRLRNLGGSTRLADKLVVAGLFESASGGYQVHDFLDFNPSREQVEVDRGIARRRAAMHANPELLRIIRDRDGNACRYCGRSVNWLDRRGPNGGTYDHVVPIASGGSDEEDNIVVACRSCNGRKGPRTPDEAGMALAEPRSPSRSGPRSQPKPNTQTQPSPKPDPTESPKDSRDLKATNGRAPSDPASEPGSFEVAASGIRR